MEGDAGTRQLNPTDAEDTPADELTEQSNPVADIDERRPSRLGRGWLAVICVGLLILTAAAVVPSWRTLTLPETLHLGRVIPDASRISRSTGLSRE